MLMHYTEPCLPPPGLRDAILSSLEYGKGTLVSHPQETSKGQLENHALLEGDKVTNILEDEEFWSIVVTVAEVTDNQRVLELRVLA